MADDQAGDDKNSDRNVVDISEGKVKKRKGKGGGDDPPPPGDHDGPGQVPPPPGKALLYRAVARAIDRDPKSRMPHFPQRFIAVEPSKGVRNVLVVDEETGVCRYVDFAYVRNCVLQYVSGPLDGRPGYVWEVRHARDCAEVWLGLAQVVPEPPAVLWQGEEGQCFNRLPWWYDAEANGTKYPTFTKLFSRISNAKALQHWIGSLFFHYADRQQYVWIHGHGGDGKGALVRFLKRVLGEAFGAKQPPKMDDTHWTTGLLGKRLVVFPDCNSPRFPASGLFMSLTGGDPVDINPKFKSSYCADLIVKFMFMSNARPALSSEKAHMRRAIYCAFSSGPDAIDLGFEAKLWAEGGAFLSACIRDYFEKYQNHGPIETDTEELSELVSVVEEDFEVLFEQRMEAVALPPPGEGPKQYLLPIQMQEIMIRAKLDRKRQSEFLAWLERTYGVRKRNVKINGESKKVYVGVRALTQFESNDGAKW